MFNLSDFDYSLPKELIAQEPLAKRDSSRLLVVDRQKKTIAQQLFKDLPKYLQEDDLLVLNNTKVVPARLLGFKKDTLGKVDALLVSRLSDNKFQVLLRPALRVNQEIVFNHGSVKARVIEPGILEFDQDVSAEILEKIGVMPLPPYIKRTPRLEDNQRYQTVYARNPGAIASPTAGLHFTAELIAKLKNKGVEIAYLSLHTGLGTFKPVKTEDIRTHKMEKEEFLIPQETLELLSQAQKNKQRIFAVGTTTTRALETTALQPLAAPAVGEASSLHGYADLFIYPGYNFKVVDCLLTNFHLPKTTLFMLVCALAGRDLIIRAYQEAIKQKYRFYSYGDAMLIL
ncbi:MAG: tRNA preQ1(34) S-adenosylmethionine ribosyltransferase-isomerase QueA [Candidatus Omnitrophota bacterium]|nr:tRNA preQ1(34) S-adenosylmethionine ribosyltransferase-isomerase QueA [Candidatus Omnitrophota bacterium]